MKLYRMAVTKQHCNKEIFYIVAENKQTAIKKVEDRLKVGYKISKVFYLGENLDYANTFFLR